MEEQRNLEAIAISEQLAQEFSLSECHKVRSHDYRDHFGFSLLLFFVLLICFCFFSNSASQSECGLLCFFVYITYKYSCR
jgi:hypothetical protein